MTADLADPFAWVVRDTGEAPSFRHVQTCWHFYDESVPDLATLTELAALPICQDCRADVERRETAWELTQRLKRYTRGEPGYKKAGKR